MQLTLRQERFVAEYVVTRNGAESARRAGYSERTARQIAAENLSKPDIQAALAAKEAELAVRLEIDREVVVGGILQSISTAMGQGNPGQAIRGWVEVARILGLDKPEAAHRALSAEDARLRAKFEGMTDEELMAIAEGRA
ncbi:hypothetical protein RHDC1_01241 [Rhodocyclaceae bacterium]|nr:hypothetical protein RHDC1_01241 [Rhodocyclaceae bacterium]